MEHVLLKTCEICGRALPVSEFTRRRTMPDGLDYRCKDCRRAHRTKTIRRVRSNVKIELDNITDDCLIGELRRRGFAGELSYCKTITI